MYGSRQCVGMATTTTTRAKTAYLVNSAFGYHIDCNPFRAYAYAAQAGMITGSCEVNLRATANVHNIADRSLDLWFLPDADAFEVVERNAPRDRFGNICGLLLFSDVKNRRISNYIKESVKK